MFERTTPGRLAAAIGGLLLIISLFLAWAGGGSVDVGSAPAGSSAAVQQAFNNAQSALSTPSLNAFDIFGFMPFVFLLIGVLSMLPLIFDLANLDVELPFDVALVSLVGGLLALGGMLLVLDTPGSAKFGVWLALLASIAVTAGGFLQLNEPDEEAPAMAAGYAQPPAGAPAPPPAAPPAAAPPAAAPPAAQPGRPAPPPPPAPPSV